MDVKVLLTTLKKEGKAKSCLKLNTNYFDVVVQYAGIGDGTLYLCRFPYQKQWSVFLSTDTSLSFVPMIEIYATRWTIEVFFKETKQHFPIESPRLLLGQCPYRDFDAQISHVTICCILYTFLAYFRRVHACASLGALFEGIVAELVEKNLAQRLWELFEELLQMVILSIAESGLVDLDKFQRSPESAAVKALLAESLLGDQLQTFNKSASPPKWPK